MMVYFLTLWLQAVTGVFPVEVASMLCLVEFDEFDKQHVMSTMKSENDMKLNGEVAGVGGVMIYT